MSADRDLTPVVRSWLHEDAHEDAGRVLNVVLDQIDTTPQRRPWWPTRRVEARPYIFRFAVVAAIVVLAAILGYSYLNRNVGSDRPTPTPLPVATPGELPQAAALEPGTYVYFNPYTDQDPIHFNCNGGCSDYKSITFALPNGWSVADGLIAKHRDAPNEVAFSVWTPDWVYPDPCHWQATPVVERRDFGPLSASGQETGLDKLANLAGRPGLAPDEVTFGREPNAGVSRFEITVPADLDISRCDGGEYRSWTALQDPERANSHHAAGQIDDVYLIDVDRHMLLLDASHRSAASRQDLAELQAVLDSIVIDRSGTPTSSAGPAAFPFPTGTQAVMGPGTYALGASFPAGITFEAPFPWGNCSQGPLEVGVCLQSNHTVGLGFLIVANVVADPCASDASLLDPPVGPTVDDLVTAISSLAGFEATPSTAISVDGFQGKQFAVTAPDNTACNLLTWTTATRANGVRPGEVNLIRILDVSGTRVMITAAYVPADSSTQEQADLMYLVNSVTITP